MNGAIHESFDNFGAEWKLSVCFGWCDERWTTETELLRFFLRSNIAIITRKLLACLCKRKPFQANQKSGRFFRLAI